MNTELISPRMLEAGSQTAQRMLVTSDTDFTAELAAAIYEAMHVRHRESLQPDYDDEITDEQIAEIKALTSQEGEG